MFKYFDKLFKRKKQPPKHKLPLEQRISLIAYSGANKVVTEDYVSISPDAILIFKGEKDGKMFFKYKNSFIPTEYEPQNNDTIYFYTANFLKLQYKRV
jgi:hypothetical protein